MLDILKKIKSKLKVGENFYLEDQLNILEEKKFYESLYHSTNVNPKNFKISPFFNPEHVIALSKEENKSCKRLANKKNVQMRSKPLTITKPWAMMVCQLNSSASFGLIF